MRVVEQEDVLRHHRHRLAPPRDEFAGERRAVDEHPARRRRQQPDGQVGDGGLPRPRRTDERGGRAGRELERHAVQHLDRLAVRPPVGKTDTVEAEPIGQGESGAGADRRA